MPTCPACGAARASDAAPCASCGAGGAAVPGPPSFDLDLPRRSSPGGERVSGIATARRSGVASVPSERRSAPFGEAAPEIDLAFDPRSLPAPQAAAAPGVAPGVALALRPAQPLATVDDVEADARLLAEHGAPPRHWLGSVGYAVRVIRRQRELRRALAVRREEASHARGELEDALVVFGESVRGAAEKRSDYADALEQLRRAEDVLRSRDQVLAAENDAHSARLASVDSRIGKLEVDREQARTEERNAAAQLAMMQAELARAEAGVKQAESELRAAQQRESTRGRE